MAIKITNDCIVCNLCAPECPNVAIYEPGVEWTMHEGTTLNGPISLHDGLVVDAHKPNPPLDNEYFYIVPDKCTECQGFHSEPQCAAVCPVDACVPDELYVETIADLMVKKELLHG